MLNLTSRFLAVVAVVLCVAGCDQAESRVVETKQPKKAKKPAAKVVERQPPTNEEVNASPPKRSEPPRERTFADLIAQAEAEKSAPLDPMRYPKPEIDEAKAIGRGIRKLTGEHITLYTDVPSSPAVDELPRIFDLALPQWQEYFAIEPDRGTKWHVVGVIAKEKEKFFETGLWPDDLPPFLHGYARNNMLWLYDQPSDFYRRHLLLHEGTHAFMWAFLGNTGPAWYTEGTAELLGTHEWSEGKLTLGVIPPSKEASPMWGRVKVIRDGFAENKALPLPEVLALSHRAFLDTKPYAWCWGASVFFDHDPQFRSAFREASQTVDDVSPTFSERLVNRLPQPGYQIAEQWQCFVANLDYGYDVARESIIRKEEPEPLPDEGVGVTVVADHGWQSSGYLVEAGKTYTIEATGRFQIGKSTKPWISEPNGITLRYYKGKPIGQLLAAVTDEGESGGLSPLLTPIAIGSRGEITPDKSGVLYLRLNDAPNSLQDNEGEASVRVGVK